MLRLLFQDGVGAAKYLAARSVIRFMKIISCDLSILLSEKTFSIQEWRKKRLNIAIVTLYYNQGTYEFKQGGSYQQNNETGLFSDFTQDMPNKGNMRICRLKSYKLYQIYYFKAPYLHSTMATFTLSNINLQVNGISFPQQVKKILKVESSNLKVSPNIQIIKLKPAEVLNEQSLQWHQTLTLPAKYNTPFPFEVQSQSNSHGYNPQDIDSVLQGEIIFKKKDKNYYGWEVTSNGKKVGFLFANFEQLSKLDSKKNLSKVIQNNSSFFGSTIDVANNSIAFISLYANFPLLSGFDKSRVYLEFEIGSITQRSAIKRLHQNEYRSHEVLQIRHNNPKADKLTLSAYTFDAHGNKIERLGKGGTHLILKQENIDLSLDERVKLERVFLYNEHSEEIGWVSFKYIKTKEQSLDPRYFLQDKFNTIGDINFRPLKNSSMTISQDRRGRSFMSGLESNNRIYIPKSQRFDNPSKRKACEQIGIIHQSINIHDFPSTHKYKFASLGYGHKVMPVERDHEVPGAGRYVLPSLFDRFK